MRSEARARWARATEGRTTEEIARVDFYEGVVPPARANRVSPCRCPQYRPTAPEYAAARLSAAVREVDERRRGARW
ncbi:hypothetical protein [Streptomyces uncialis]|uniref:hypothetical protein n=1 Tax=Streptomyces uncialis TaxID=1048205 RepID=UPI003867B762|nr:hypothetical protein OG268_14705 [Streptomyces uncialis]